LAIHRSQAIVAELRKSLNIEEGGEIAANLDRLYSYVHQLLVKSMLENQSEPLDEAVVLLMELRGAWSEVAKPAKEPQGERRLGDSTLAIGSTVSETPSVKITV
jgi:flagellar protein FliS